MLGTILGVSGYTTISTIWFLTKITAFGTFPKEHVNREFNVWLGGRMENKLSWLFLKSRNLGSSPGSVTYYFLLISWNTQQISEIKFSMVHFINSNYRNCFSYQRSIITIHLWKFDNIFILKFSITYNSFCNNYSLKVQKRNITILKSKIKYITQSNNLHRNQESADCLKKN